VGQSAAQTVAEIERIRTQLDLDLHELQARMPKPVVWAKRAVGVAVGGGAGGAMLWMLIRRRRKQRREVELERLQRVVLVPLEALARLRTTDGDRIASDDDPPASRRSIGLMVWGAAAAGVFAGMRIAESMARRGGRS
jgi:hypothetical protein